MEQNSPSESCPQLIYSFALPLPFQDLYKLSIYVFLQHLLADEATENETLQTCFPSCKQK